MSSVGYPTGRFCLLLASSFLVLTAGTAPADSRTGGERPRPPQVVDVAADMRALVEADWIDNDRRFDAQGATVAGTDRAVTTVEDAAGACDGFKTGLWGFHVASGETDPWWQVDLGQVYRLDRVVVYNRCDASPGRTGKLQILVTSQECVGQDGQFTQVYQHDGTPFGGVVGKPLEVRFDGREVSARVVRLRIPGRCSFALDEVEVYAADDPTVNVALNQPANQISVSRYSAAGTMSDAEFQRLGFKPLASRPVVPADESGRGFPLAHTRAVIDQAQQLAARLAQKAELPELTPLSAALDPLAARAEELASADGGSEAARRELYLEARTVKRRIAFCNPLLTGIDRLLFLKRHDSVGVYHMCDQYYGCNAKPGGGLYVLEDPFGQRPRLVNLLENSVVESGRLKGQKLVGGSFLSPVVSWDGDTIYFAYSQAGACEKYRVNDG